MCPLEEMSLMVRPQCQALLPHSYLAGARWLVFTQRVKGSSQQRSCRVEGFPPRGKCDLQFLLTANGAELISRLPAIL